MKNLTLVLLFLLISFSGFSQAPEFFKYQGILNNASGQALANQNVAIKISILQGSATGTSVYAELHSTKTNPGGLFSLEIGSGTAQSGAFNTIGWGDGSYFVKIQTDINNDNVFEDAGTSQLVSVPYALYAKTSGDNSWEKSLVNNDIHYSKGNVGIGIDAPAEALHINGSIRGNQSGAVRINTEFGYVDVGPKNTDYAHFYTNMPYGFYFDGSVTVRNHLIGYKASDLNISTQSNSDFQPVKRITILNASGNVGIANTNPLYPLDVNGAVNATGYLLNGQPLNSVWSVAGSNAYYNTGKVGVGNTNPQYPLDVTGAVNATSYLLNGQPLSTVWSVSGNNTYYNNGNVGIGTNSPQETLHINGNIRGNQNGGALRINTTYGYIDVGPKNTDYAHFYTNMPFGFYFNGNVTVRDHLIGYQSSDLNISTQSTVDFQPVKRITILNSNGNVGVGTASPKSRLQVESGDVYISNISSGVIMKSPNGQCWRMTVDNSGSPVFTSVACP